MPEPVQGDERSVTKYFPRLQCLVSSAWLPHTLSKRVQRLERGSIIRFPHRASLNVTPGQKKNMKLHLIWQQGSLTVSSCCDCSCRCQPGRCCGKYITILAVVKSKFASLHKQKMGKRMDVCKNLP